MAKPLNESLRDIYIETPDGMGNMLEIASESLAELVKGVSAYNKAGSLTLKISIRPSTAGAMAVTGKVTPIVPKGAPTESLLWPTPEGNLLSEDPKQKKFDLRPVAAMVPDLKPISKS
ncbi:MAG: hypothetical protein ABIT70_02435 [Sulfuriferula sp.]